MKENSSRGRLFSAFAIYIILLLCLLFARDGTASGADYFERLKNGVNFIPFLTVRRYISLILRGRMLFAASANILGNIILFIPAGVFIPALFPRCRNYLLFAAAVISGVIFIETAQLFTLLGRFDIDDIILNLIGATAGYIIYKKPIRRKK